MVILYTNAYEQKHVSEENKRHPPKTLLHTWYTLTPPYTMCTHIISTGYAYIHTHTDIVYIYICICIYVYRDTYAVHSCESELRKFAKPEQPETETPCQ